MVKSLISKTNSFFVSRFNYPNISVSLMTQDSKNESNKGTLKNSKLNCLADIPKPQYYRKSINNIDFIVDDRKRLLNSYFNNGIFQKNQKIYSVHELAMSRKPVDVELNFTKDINSFVLKNKSNDLIFDKTNTDLPVSSYLPLFNFKPAENIKYIPTVEKIYYDKDISAVESIKQLNPKIDIYKMIELFSVGVLGKKLNTKLVPSRWSITATDDIASKKYLDDIKNFDPIKRFELYYSKYLGNHYITLFLPKEWSYELFEFGIDGFINKSNSFKIDNQNQIDALSTNENTSLKNKKIETQKIILSSPHTDFEFYSGRKEYAYNCAGGYYAVRYSITKYLHLRKRQASVISFRFIDKTYNTPLGVWVCREASNFELSKCIGFYDDLELSLKDLNKFVISLGIMNLNEFINQSRILKEYKFQSRLTHFLV